MRRRNHTIWIVGGGEGHEGSVGGRCGEIGRGDLDLGIILGIQLRVAVAVRRVCYDGGGLDRVQGHRRDGKGVSVSGV